MIGDGTELDEFRLVRLLGRGGMGQVWVGHDTLLDRPVAIKLIGARNPDAVARDRFLIEARAVARLQHPNVVTIFRVGTTADGRPYLAQELLRGTSLDCIERPLPGARIRELALGIARGLAAAHRRGILHRDVKPANVMLADTGIKLLDFGLAKLVHVDDRESFADAPLVLDALAPVAATAPTVGAARVDVSADAGLADACPATRRYLAPFASPPVRLDLAATIDPPDGTPPPRTTSRRPESPAPSPIEATDEGMVLGTPRYLAPELWRGERATVRSDLYALGVLLHELATGAAPYPSSDLDALRESALAGGAPPVLARAPDLGPRLGALIDRLIAHAPADRPASADDVVHELEAMAIASGPLPAGNPYRGLRTFEAEHRALFFGRGRDISALCDLLRTESLVCVAGDSGIGKSSICRAGVAPAVAAGALDDARTWRTVTLLPGRTPATALAAALELPVAVAAAPDAPLDRPPSGAPERLRCRAAPAGEGVLLVVDQLEELITLAAPDEAAAAAEILVAVAAGVPGVKILCTVRGDFLTRVAALPDLGPALARGLHLLRTLTEDDLRETVVGPARATGVRFESDALVAALVAGAASGGLPLLQFALAELWDARDAGRALITSAALDELGGVGGALARHADRALAPLTTETRAAARRLLMRMVSPDRTRVVRAHGELVPGGDAAASAALEALIRGRLIVARETVDGGATYELAHEALIEGWPTLRGWLDDAAGRRAQLERLAAAAADWERRGRRADLLWGRAQLADLGRADLRDDLDARDRAFVEASRRSARRRRLIAATLAVLVPAGIALAIAIPRIEARRARDRAVARSVAAASRHLADATAADERGAALMREAFAAFDAGNAEATAAAEATWSRSIAADLDARRAYREAAAALEAAVLRDAGRTDLRRRMAEVLHAHALVAERRHDADGAAELVARVAQYDSTGEIAARWNAPATLELDAPGATRIEVNRLPSRSAEIPNQLQLVETIEPVPPVERVLQSGTYVVVVAFGETVVRDVVRLRRGERVKRTIDLPPEVPEGFVYVPAGRFLIGSDQDDAFRKDFLYAPPLHESETGAFLIGRYETTMGEWLEYMGAVDEEERERRRPRTQATNGLLLQVAEGRVSMVIGSQVYEADGGVITFPKREKRKQVRVERMPVAGVDWEDVVAYTAWLDETGRVPGARPCHEREWERAARGADGRNTPGGGRLGVDDANHDATYARAAGAMGPDEVGVHPASDSPFGVADLAGNVWEWVVTADGTPATRGGSWYHGATTALIPNRDFTEPTMRTLDTGLRVCADAPPAR